MTKSTLPKGPQAPGIVQSARFLWDPFPFLEKSEKRYGDVFTTNSPGLHCTVVISEPDLFKQVIKEHRENLKTAKINKKFMGTLVSIYY